MPKLIPIAVAMAVLGVSATALAYPPPPVAPPPDYDGTPPPDYDGAMYADVLNTQPIYHVVRVAEPRQECY
ncbi:MAG: hypothetical protein JWR16_1007, partial [Nevskia sp.]|nr:hypothetical protein [Nevskia sp.]